MSPSDSLQCVDGSGLPGQSQSRSGVTNQTAHVDIPFYGVVRRKKPYNLRGQDEHFSIICNTDRGYYQCSDMVRDRR